MELGATLSQSNSLLTYKHGDGIAQLVASIMTNNMSPMLIIFHNETPSSLQHWQRYLSCFANLQANEYLLVTQSNYAQTFDQIASQQLLLCEATIVDMILNHHKYVNNCNVICRFFVSSCRMICYHDACLNDSPMLQRVTSKSTASPLDWCIRICQQLQLVNPIAKCLIVTCVPPLQLQQLQDFMVTLSVQVWQNLSTQLIF